MVSVVKTKEAVAEVPARAAIPATQAEYQLTVTQAELDALTTILGDMRGHEETKEITTGMYTAFYKAGGRGFFDGGPFKLKQYASGRARHLGLSDRKP